MIKEIYIIKNTVNSKVYIGQSVNSKQRWAAHLSNAKLGRHWSAIDQAINKIGPEKFYYEVIETTHNYDEREAYWINYYDSLLPNGYNYCLSGGGAASGVGSANAKIRNNETLEAIINQLMCSNDSQVSIAKEYNVNKNIISSINRGTAYKIPGISYPIRKKNRDITETMARRIQQDLLTQNYLLEELTVRYCCSLNTIQQINRGTLFKQENYSYPLFSGNRRNKKLSLEDEQSLKSQLQYETISIAELAKQYNISSRYVRLINIGESKYEEGLNYPLRKRN